MEVSSKYVGSQLRDYETRVAWRDTMNYAASIGDNNPRYLDDEREEGVVAPPLFAVAVTWPIVEKIWDYIEIEDFPREVLLTQVHYTEHLEFHRPVRPGDGLRIKGRIAAILPHRAGTHIVVRFDALDENGAPVFVEHVGAMMRGVECTDEGRGGEDLPADPRHPGNGAPIWDSHIPIDPLAPYVYDGCSNIFFPIHTSVKFARQVGLPGIIVQGTATLALAVRELIDREAGGDPLALRSLACRFTGTVLPGTAIRVLLIDRQTLDDGAELYFAVLNAQGDKAISDGHARLGG
jgi:acyl dehydratase